MRYSSSYDDILRVIANAAKKHETVKIFYPQTENTKASWREVEPYSLTIDPGPDTEHLIYNKDRISPGHIFNAYTIHSNDNHCDSFIIGKIKDAKYTNNKFSPRNNWQVEF